MESTLLCRLVLPTGRTSWFAVRRSSITRRKKAIGMSTADGRKRVVSGMRVEFKAAA